MIPSQMRRTWPHTIDPLRNKRKDLTRGLSGWVLGYEGRLLQWLVYLAWIRCFVCRGVSRLLSCSVWPCISKLFWLFCRRDGKNYSTAFSCVVLYAVGRTCWDFTLYLRCSCVCVCWWRLLMSRCRRSSWWWLESLHWAPIPSRPRSIYSIISSYIKHLCAMVMLWHY